MKFASIVFPRASREEGSFSHVPGADQERLLGSDYRAPFKRDRRNFTRFIRLIVRFRSVISDGDEILLNDAHNTAKIRDNSKGIHTGTVIFTDARHGWDRCLAG
jgi:hypothetical protein